MKKDRREAAKRLEELRPPSGVDPGEQLARVRTGRKATLTRARREPFSSAGLVERLAVKPREDAP